ncbi:TatD family hydrolase [Pseudidiomarina homiensis]|uniref:TatD family hydrolase n=1 Tax=Pseudidiomarina homiensis TaxID=364198 RepID=UPI00215B39D9|nr:TatD family hydrolase [Pseudidiomarina homiensis]
MVESLFDTHCHLDFEVFDADREEVLHRAEQVGVQHILVPGTRRMEHFSPCFERGSHVQLHRAVGLHPYFITQHQTQDLNWVAKQLQHDKRLLVGEIGLDRTCPEWQKQCDLFEQQVQLAVRYRRPLILHHRKSQSDLLGLLTPYLAELPQCKGVLHAFSGSSQQAYDWIAKGFKLGVGGTITYARAAKTRAAIAEVPLSGLVLETDAPDMPLAGHQGRRNEPSRLADIFAALTELRQESASELRRKLWENSLELIDFLAADASDDSAIY